MKKLLATTILALLLAGSAEAQQNSQTQQRRKSSGMQNTDSSRRMRGDNPGMTPNRRMGVRGMDSTGRPVPRTDTVRMRGTEIR